MWILEGDRLVVVVGGRGREEESKHREKQAQSSQSGEMFACLRNSKWACVAAGNEQQGRVVAANGVGKMVGGWIIRACLTENVLVSH